MNAHRFPQRFVRFHIAVIASLLAVVGLAGGLAPSAFAQVSPGSVLATQFFGSITGDANGYQLSADAVLHAPGGDYVGRDGLDQFRVDLETSFSDLEFRTENAAQSGELVIVSFTLTGINTGAYRGLSPNCAGIAVPGVAMLRLSAQSMPLGSQHFDTPQAIETTEVVEQWISYDADALASQIAAFNEVAASGQAGCAGHYLPQQEAPAPELPPTCLSKNVCETPY